MGRDAELAVVAELLTATAGGTAHALLLEGEPGIGKSRLIDEIVEAAADRGFATFRAGGDELASGRPFGTLVEALGVDPPDGAGRLAELRYQVVDEFLDVLEGLAERSPVVVALDDLQWIESSTLSILPTLHRRLADVPLLLVGAFRGGPARELDRITYALVSQGATHLVLPPLADDAVDRLIESLVAAVPGPRLRHHATRAGGNPWLIVDLVAALRAEGAIDVAGGEAETPEGALGALPGSFRAGVLRRLRQLPDRTVEALRMAAILGTRFSFEDLCVVLDQAASRVLTSLEPALHAGLVGEADDQLVFRHALVREAVYEEVPRTMRPALHREAAQALTGAGRRASLVARHIALGATPGDAEAVVWLHKAAHDAAPHDPVEAIQLLERALELCPATEPARGAILADLVTSLGWAGRAAEARSRAEEALSSSLDPHAAMAVRRGLVRALLMQGDLRGALAQVELAGRADHLVDTERAELWADAAMGSLLVGDLGTALERAVDAVRLAEEVQDPLALTAALCTEAWVRNLSGDYDESIRLSDRAVAIERATRAAEVSQRHPQFFSGIVLINADRWEDGERQLRAGRQRGEEVGTFWDLPLYHWAFALLHFVTGRWDDFEAEVESGLAHSADTGIRLGIVWPHAFRALVGIHRDRLDVADAALAVVDEEVAERGPQFGVDWAMWARALLLEARGDHTTALTVLRQAWQLDTAMGIVSELHAIGPDLVRLALVNDDIETAAAVTRDVEQVAARAGVGSFRAAGLRCRGLLERDPDALLSAVALLRSTPR
ncbi:MAG: ATP-binding protein, partial [Acidimicrobiales bacterium]